MRQMNKATSILFGLYPNLTCYVFVFGCSHSLTCPVCFRSFQHQSNICTNWQHLNHLAAQSKSHSVSREKVRLKKAAHRQNCIRRLNKCLVLQFSPTGGAFFRIFQFSRTSNRFENM